MIGGSVEYYLKDLVLWILFVLAVRQLVIEIRRWRK